ncbi:phosphotransferase family protein [Streptomyces hirsutus]|uniref:phosphotransferase family protein n=1 Tax=Streptomyces hirsutus TaxID=35620 RepID=UPI0036B8D525
MSAPASGALVDVVDTSAQRAALAHPPLLVREPLAAFLDAEGMGRGPVREARIGEGHSNVTYLLRRDGWEGVLRRPPRPPYQESAHDVLREARVQRALLPTAVPVPRILATEPTGSVLGVPFYVMDKLTGDVVTGSVPTALDTPEGRYGLGTELVDTLVRLHQVDIDAAGLRSLGRGERFLDRQLRTFGHLWDTHRTRAIPAVDEAGQWLLAHRPAQSDTTLVHGDYRLGNLMFAPGSTPRLLALLDWELATLGDPLTDLGYLLSTYPEGTQDSGALLSLAGAVRGGHFPTRGELVCHYAERTGRSTDGLHWYVALAFWRTAVGLESFYRRALQGTTDDPFIAELEHGVPELAEQALAAAY